jgi:hypothetical protein
MVVSDLFESDRMIGREVPTSQVMELCCVLDYQHNASKEFRVLVDGERGERFFCPLTNGCFCF